MSIIKLSSIEFRNQNLWEMYFTDNPEIRFNIKSTSLPFIKFETYTRNTGTKHYLRYEPEDEFSITFNETQDFQVYDYFDNWINLVYDKRTRRFRTGKHTKDAVLAFQSFTGPLLARILSYEKAFKFENILVKGLSDWDLNYDNIENQAITIPFSADSVNEISTSMIATF